jgi:hypothetical protein
MSSKEITETGRHKAPESPTTFDPIKQASLLLRDTSSRVEILDTDFGKNRCAIKDILTAANETINTVDSLRSTNAHEKMQIKKYFDICAGKLQDCISKVKEYDSKESNDNAPSKEVEDLIDTNKEAIKAISIINFRKQYSTARDILSAYSPPRDLLEWHAQFSSQCWLNISRERAKKELGRELEGDELEEYHEHYLRKLDKHALDLVKSEDTQICIGRRAHKISEILECGRIKSMFETQTAGAEALGSKKQTKIEEACYGFLPDYLDEVRPLYASVTKGSYTSKDTQGFGAAIIKLKPLVRERATKVMYDSALLAPHEDCHKRFLAGRPVPFNEPGRDCFSLTDPHPDYYNPDLAPDKQQDLLTALRKKDPLKFETANDVKPWLEAQIHGAVTIDDIKEIHFTKFFNFEIKLELDKKVNEEQKDNLRSILRETAISDTENLLGYINKMGLTRVIKFILDTNPINDQIKTRLEQMHQERLEYLEKSAKEQRETLEKLLNERGIAYSFDQQWTPESAKYERETEREPFQEAKESIDNSVSWFQDKKVQEYIRSAGTSADGFRKLYLQYIRYARYYKNCYTTLGNKAFLEPYKECAEKITHIEHKLKNLIK